MTTSARHRAGIAGTPARSPRRAAHRADAVLSTRPRLRAAAGAGPLAFALVLGIALLTVNPGPGRALPSTAAVPAGEVSIDPHAGSLGARPFTQHGRALSDLARSTPFTQGWPASADAAPE